MNRETRNGLCRFVCRFPGAHAVQRVSATLRAASLAAGTGRPVRRAAGRQAGGGAAATRPRARQEHLPARTQPGEQYTRARGQHVGAVVQCPKWVQQK